MASRKCTSVIVEIISYSFTWSVSRLNWSSLSVLPEQQKRQQQKTLDLKINAIRYECNEQTKQMHVEALTPKWALNKFSNWNYSKHFDKCN